MKKQLFPTLFLFALTCGTGILPATAQISPDTTLGNESSRVRQGNIKGLPSDILDKGARRGKNLFHSFSEFNVNAGRGAYFTNPKGVENIFSRVTGSDISQIFGTLGVLGNANLYFLNPNGIIFGPNARLDLNGSFLGTTADSVIFDNSYQFSASNPDTPPLLTVNIPVGLGMRANAGDIIVQTGQNVELTTVSENLDAGQLLENAQTINNPNTEVPGLIYGGLSEVNDVDLYRIYLRGGTTITPSTVGGTGIDTRLFLFDAEGLGISANEDSQGTFQSTLPEVTQSGIYYLAIANFANAPLSAQGEIFAFNPNTAQFEGLGIGGNSPLNNWDNNSFFGSGPYNLTLIKENTNALQVKPGKTLALVGGNLIFDGGKIVSLGSNVYLGSLKAEGNLLLQEGIKPVFPEGLKRGDVTMINASLIDVSRSDGKNGGKITIVGNNITTGTLLSYSNSLEGAGGNGGAITLTASGNITTDYLDSNSNSSEGSGGNGGAITLTAGGNITTDYLKSSSYSGSGAGGNGGAIVLTAGGNITTDYLDSSSFADGGGDGGEINLKAGGNITTDYLYSASTADSGVGGNGGAISLVAGGKIDITSVDSNSLSFNNSTGNAGAIVLTAGGDITTGYLSSRSTSDSGDVGNGGAISLSSGGDITTGYLFSYITSDSGAAGRGGDVSIKILEGKLLIPYINSSATGIGGNGGDVNLSGNKLELTDIVINTDGKGGSNGGLIQLNAPSIQITNSDLSSSSFGSGTSGSIFLTSSEKIQLNNSRLLTALEPGSTGMGGDIEIQSKNLSLIDFSLIDTGTYSGGNAGNIKIKAETISLQDGSSIRSLTTSTGNAGNIFLNAPRGEISLTNSSNISTSATQTASGNSGNIETNSRTLSLLNGSQIQSLTEGINQSEAGNIIINADNQLTIATVDPEFLNRDPEALPGENIPYRDYDPTNPFEIDKIEGNNSIATSQKLSTDDFSLNNPNAFNPNVEYSSRSPYVAIEAVGDDTVDIYSVKVNAGTRAAFDIDGSGYNEQADADNNNLISFPAINTKITLLNSQGKVLASNDDASHGLGAGGSRTSMTLQQDPYLRYTFPKTGTYYIQVSNFDGKGVPSSYIDFFGNPQTTGYDLQISLEPNPIQANLSNQGQPSGIFAYTQGKGKAGDITLNSPKLTVQNGGQISAFTRGRGDGGTIILNTPNSLILGENARLSVETESAGRAGNITINSPIITIGKNAELSARATATSTNKKGGGSITLNTNNLNISGKLGIFAETNTTTPAGNLTIEPFSGSPLLPEGGTSEAPLNKGGWGDHLNINFTQEGNISARTTASGRGGNIDISSPDTINIQGQGKITAETSGSGNAGNLYLHSQTLNLADGVEISASTTAQGNAGNIQINALNTLTLGDKILLTVETLDSGNAGNIDITTPILTIGKDAELSARTREQATGKAGNITLNVSKLNISGDLGIFAETEGIADAGNLSIKPFSPHPQPLSQGARGDSLKITFTQEGNISASTKGSGNGGNITITAPETINLSGNGNIKVETSGSGNAGNIYLNSQTIKLTDGVEISASTSGMGNAGQIELTAKELKLTNNSALQTDTDRSGKAGDINLIIAKELTLNNSRIDSSTSSESGGDGGNINIDPITINLRNNSAIAVNSLGAGNGGSISLITQDLNLDKSTISALSNSGQGGNITLNVPNYTILKNSPISATAGTEGGAGDGGNITLNTKFLTADNSDITANAYLGAGGNVNITATGIYLDRNSLITASSQYGADGVVETNTPAIDPTRGILNFPSEVTDAADLIANNFCDRSKGSKYVVTGKGGLPPTPYQERGDDGVRVDLLEPVYSPQPQTQGGREGSSPKPQKFSSREIVPARGWIINGQGMAVLVGYDPVSKAEGRGQEAEVVSCPAD
jgi:filamentous hemagglutinin family protein